MLINCERERFIFTVFTIVMLISKLGMQVTGEVI